MRLPYPRPSKLSDPHFDFTPETLGQLLGTPDGKLQWHQLQSLLGPFLPAGTFRESAYFLPFAFECLNREEEHALDLTTSVTWFVSEYADELATDGLLEECRSEIMGCLLHWTRDFSVVHFDRDACAAKGWRLGYFDYVQRAEAICQTLCDLDRFARHADLADRFIRHLSSSIEPASVGWFLELARSQDDVYHPPAREAYQRHFTDMRLLAQKQSVVEQRLAATTASSTYWNDVFTQLGLKRDVGHNRA